MISDDEHADAMVALAEKLNDNIPAGTSNGVAMGALATLLGGNIRVAQPHEKEEMLSAMIALITQIARLAPPEDLH